MSEWTIGDALPARQMCRRMINAQMSPLALSVDSQDLINDLIKYKERALNVHIAKALPKFMLSTPAMIRRATTVDALLKRVESVHTPAQRSGCPRDIADDWLSLHTSDPQLMPESNLRFVLSAALVASVYLGDALSFAVYAMASQPAMYESIRSEADALFGEGDPEGSAFTPETMNVTVRFLMECLRMYPIVPMAMRDVMNSCVVEGYELPVGSRVYIAQTASHYMEDVFPEPYTFDIDRYLPPRNEQRSPGYAPIRTGHAPMSGFPVDGSAARNQRAHDRTLLPSGGVSRKLRASLQPTSFLEAEQQPEIPCCRTTTETTCLTGSGAWPLCRGGNQPAVPSQARSSLLEHQEMTKP